TPPEITETAETPEIPEAPTETADTTQLTAAVNEALEAGNFEAAETLLTEAAETGAYPEDALHQLRAETAVQHISNDEEMQSKITAVGKGLAVLQKAQEAGVINEDWWEDGHIQEILYCAFFTMDAPSYRQMEAHDEVEVDMEEARILIEEVAGLEFVPENLPSAPISGEGGGHAYYSGGKLYATWGHTGGGSAGIYKGVQYDAASGEIRVSGIDDEGYSEGGYATPFTMTMAPADNPFGVTVTGVEVGEGYEYGPGEEP
ncbi:MAG: hypothetical protein IJP92_10925, partial [Lachnospiraceae bacterium]|nr:hypothetical protein [Lachnospiraceae bacterium]